MTPSPFYPPRAGPWSRFRVRMDRSALRLRHRWSSLGITSQDIHVPFPRGLPWLLIPGLMWRHLGRKRLGDGLLVAWATLVTVHLLTINPSLATMAAMLASILHAVSAAAVLSRLFPHWQGFSGMIRSSLYASLLVFCIYSFGLRALLSPFAQRMTIGEKSIMVHRIDGIAGTPWSPGEWVTYRLPNGGMLNLDRILAGPGDTLRFHDQSFEVNGRFFEQVSSNMPDSGERVMAPRTYFIWPSQASFNYGGGDQSEPLLRLSEIDESEIVGRPYRHWLWRPVDLPSLNSLPASAPPP